jgi:hypothetical protein
MNEFAVPRMNRSWLGRHRGPIVLSILLAFPVYSTIHQFVLEKRGFHLAAGPYDVARIDQEVSGFQSYLALQPVTGVFSELPESDPWNLVAYLQFQYAAAPNIIRLYTRTRYALGRFRDPAAIPAFLQREHFTVLKTYPDGVALLESAK